MGFNLRYVSKGTILETLKNDESILKLFSNDAIIFEDDFSSEIHSLLMKGVKEKEVIKVIKENI